MNKIKICFTSDNNYAQYIGTAIASILNNSAGNDSFHFYVVVKDISQDNKEKIENLKHLKDFDITFINVTEEDFKEFLNIKTTDYLTLASFFRLKLASLINEDKIIYLDPDTIINTSLAPLFDIDITDYYCAGVLDIGHKRHAKRLNLKSYVNSGVLLINLKKWREFEAEKQFITYTSENIKNIRMGDQDAINACFKNNILILDNKWNWQVINFCSYSDYCGKFNIIHYTGKAKPWKFGSYIPFKKYYFDSLALTQWEKPDNIWHLKSTFFAILLYIKHRPLFIFRPSLYRTLLAYLKTF